MKRQRRSSTNGEAEATEENYVSFILEVPLFILHEIFFRIPIKSIMRCKCVSKEWNNLLSDPNFSDSYAKHSKFTRALCFPTCIFYGDENAYLVEISENGDSSRVPIDLDLNPRCFQGDYTWYSSFVGCSNGFACLSFYKNHRRERIGIIYVCNPLFGGGSIALPECDGLLQGKVRVFFGFNPSGNNYKVLRIEFKGNSPSSGLVKVEICTVGADACWRRLSTPFMHLGSKTKVIDFNGMFNWFPQSNPGSFISTFDLAEEKLGQIPIPPNLVLCPSDDKELRIFDNQFSLVDYSNPLEIGIWTMKNYPVFESWTRSTVITFSWAPTNLEFKCFRPITKLKDGKILFECCFDQSLISFNPKQQNNGFEFYCTELNRARVGFAPNFFCRVEDL